MTRKGNPDKPRRRRVLKAGDRYRCSMCRRVFMTQTADAKAWEEFDRLYGHIAKRADAAIVCDACNTFLLNRFSEEQH